VSPSVICTLLTKTMKVSDHCKSFFDGFTVFLSRDQRRFGLKKVRRVRSCNFPKGTARFRRNSDRKPQICDRENYRRSKFHFYFQICQKWGFSALTIFRQPEVWGRGSCFPLPPSLSHDATERDDHAVLLAKTDRCLLLIA